MIHTFSRVQVQPNQEISAPVPPGGSGHPNNNNDISKLKFDSLNMESTVSATTFDIFSLVDHK